MIDLKNLTIVCPFQADSNQRIANLKTIISYFKQNFTNYGFIIVENNKDDSQTEKLFDFGEEKITKWITLNHSNERDEFNCGYYKNFGIEQAASRNVLLYDVDVIIHPNSLEKALIAIDNDLMDFVYPYDGHFVLCDQINKSQFIESAFSFNLLVARYARVPKILNGEANGLKVVHFQSNGGCLLVNKEKFIDSGGFSPEMRGRGYEDTEYYQRVKRIGYRIGYVSGYPLFHLFHDAPTNCARDTQKDIEHNKAICVKNLTLLKPELIGVCEHYRKINFLHDDN